MGSPCQSCREERAEGTHRTIEGQEGLEQLILGEERMPRHKVDEPRQGTPSALNELPIRCGGQNCREGSVMEKREF